MVEISIKIHEAYRKIVAVCDKELIGKKFEENNLQLDINPKFYSGEYKDDEDNEEEIIELLKDQEKEDSCFNIVGENACNIAIKAGIIDESSIIQIQGIKHALSLL